MKSIKVCEYSRSRSFHDDLILQEQGSGERFQDQWSSVFLFVFFFSRNDDYIVSFLKNTDVENIKKMGTIPEEHAVPPSQIAKKIKPPKQLKRQRMILYQFNIL